MTIRLLSKYMGLGSDAAKLTMLTKVTDTIRTFLCSTSICFAPRSKTHFLAMATGGFVGSVCLIRMVNQYSSFVSDLSSVALKSGGRFRLLFPVVVVLSDTGYSWKK